MLLPVLFARCYFCKSTNTFDSGAGCEDTRICGVLVIAFCRWCVEIPPDFCFKFKFLGEESALACIGYGSSLTLDGDKFVSFVVLRLVWSVV